MNYQKTVHKYIDEISSNSPTPGGGNVAAFCGVLAASLGEMVCSLTVGKKKYAEVEKEINLIYEKLKMFKEEFLLLAEQDNEAFDRVMDAMKLPKETEEQKLFRKTAIDNATLEAAAIPAEVIKKCKAILPLFKELEAKGNQNSLSDIGVAVLLVGAVSHGAFLNVAINYTSLTNKTTGGEVLRKSKIIFDEIKSEAESLVNKITKKILDKNF